MKKAFLVGINYNGTPHQLRGCINDVLNMETYLNKTRKYDSVVVMTDDSDKKPTRQNIFDGIDNLVKNVNSMDELWFHFSGHGLLMTDTNGDEESGKDSCICPIDYQFISDDDIRTRLVQKIPSGATLYVVLDMCHSGTGCDLRYKFDDISYDSTPNISKVNYNPNEWVLKQTMCEYKKYEKTQGNVYCISGCQDQQTSADAYIDGNACGVLTHYLLKSLMMNSTDYKWKHLLKDICCFERVHKFSQITSLTSGKEVSLEGNVFQPPLPPPPSPTPTSTPTPTPTPTSTPTPVNVAQVPPFMLPLNILSYLSYLRRMRMKVPVWLINHIKMLEQNHYKNTKRQ